jgi:pimeloyl-ACP methyl ester carboxylesterase
LRYVIGGEGDPLILIHGWPQNWYEWNRIMPALAQNYTVIVPTMRGVGDSEKPTGTANYTKQVMAEDIHQLVQQLGFSSVKIAAHDIGAMVAYAYASRYPNEVEKLALLDAPLPGIDPFWTSLLTREDLFLWHFGLNQTDDSPEIVVGNERAYLTRMYTDFAYNQEAFREDEVDEFVRAYQGLEALQGGFEWYRAFSIDAEDNRVFAQTPLTMPVMAIGGEQALGSIMVPMLQTVVANPSQVRGGSLANTGHWLMEERPEQVLDSLQSFFSE